MKTGYIFKKGFLWLGWIVAKKEPEVILYAGNNPYQTIGPEIGLEYLTIGFTRKGVTKRLTEYCKKLAEEVKE